MCQVCLKLAQWFWRRRCFNFINVFFGVLLCDYRPLEKGRVLRLKKLESPTHKNAVCQHWLNFAQCFRRFLKYFNVFSLFRNYLPSEKCGALHLNKIESPPPKDALCKVWLKLAHWFMRKRF